MTQQLTVRQGLQMLASAEREVAQIYELALRFYGYGVLTDTMRTAAEGIARRTYETKLDTYRGIRALIAAQGLTGQIASRAIPEPSPPPDLPPAQIVGGRRVAAAPGPQRLTALRSNILAALPAWALLVLAALAIAGAVGLVLGGLYLATDLVIALASIKADTERLHMWYTHRLAAFESCMATGTDADTCARAAELLAPEPNWARKPFDPNRKTWWEQLLFWGGLVVLVGGGGYLAWRYLPLTRRRLSS
ncbi:MAG: hypothetical protein JSV86_05395 [Gemmatimonadota bacterium]|nr:MAG: hypothetical protein JSV86_05395 [Gemmatimonadota bacterium]